MKKLIRKFINSTNARYIYPSAWEIELGDDPDRVKGTRSYSAALPYAVLTYLLYIILLPFMPVILFALWLDYDNK